MVTEAMARNIESLTGVPVVSITYDGTGQYQNEAIVPYIRFAAERPVEPRARPLPLLRACQGVRGRRKLTVSG
jgi:hypothetical protein